MDSAWNLHRVSVDYGLTVHGLCMESAWTMDGFCMDCKWSLHELCMEYVRVMTDSAGLHGICMNYAWNVSIRAQFIVEPVAIFVVFLLLCLAVAIFRGKLVTPCLLL